MFRVGLFDQSHDYTIWMGGMVEETLEGTSAAFSIAELGDGDEDCGGGWRGGCGGWDGD